MRKRSQFIGRWQNLARVSSDVILQDFDRLLPIYEFVEGGDAVTTPRDGSPDEFVLGLTKRATSAEVSIVERRLNKSLRHNDLQHALGLYLIEQHGEDYVGDEQAAVAGGKIDLVVSDGSTRTYYEVKIAGRSRSCIRQALGKLLEYSYWPGAQTARKLVIVGEHRCDEAAERYMDDLRERFSLPVYHETR